MSFFSVITICRNNLKELKTTYQSLLDQSTVDYQWIVIDGLSSDGTKEWLTEIQAAQWISEKDDGIYDAMNKGIDRADGDYLIFMNSGDSFASIDVLKKSKKEIESRNHPVFVYGDSIDISEDGNKFYRKAKNHKKNWMGMITQHQAMFFNRKALNGLNYDINFPLSGDYAFISKTLKDIVDTQILQLDFPICNFSMGGVNESRRFQAIKEDFAIRKNIILIPYALNLLLYSLHYVHASLKKVTPSIRFLRHQANSGSLNSKQS
ncbi:MAG: glycosyltransferase family 2 protein [Bacteroidales bacterium]